MSRKIKFLAGFALSTLCVATAFAYSGTRYRESRVNMRPSAPVHAVSGEQPSIARPAPSEPRQALPVRRFALPPGSAYERGGQVYPQPYQNPRASSIPRSNVGRMSPEQRRALRRQINETNKDIRYQRRY